MPGDSLKLIVGLGNPGPQHDSNRHNAGVIFLHHLCKSYGGILRGESKFFISQTLWFFSKYGERETIQLIESLKKVGFQYATKAGISIGIDDLKIPFINGKPFGKSDKTIHPPSCKRLHN